ncbi:anti-sigma factor family protein [Chengkuizengella sediminis]|uniref:anti-sigma factor family protein n=1 Tax=Chengkuizengella sediminis TaxID=1885917 RepID=UPI0013898F32|nr:zf-HC2 domain-containing protein [Chengkuizengella sediminis]NDI34369.1 zf-HC2 domain-containing protein [Chengkuizengella sediminis]
MNCKEAQESFALYWDLPEENFKRTKIDQHLKTCTSCAEEFEIWEKSHDFIHMNSSLEDEHPFQTNQNISGSVMDRIYMEESWKVPIQDRIYSLSFKFKRNITLLISFCFAIFVTSLFLSISNKFQADNVEPVEPTSGIVTVASINNPLQVKIISDPSFPDYLIVLSLLGVIGAILILNWFTRIRT